MEKINGSKKIAVFGANKPLVNFYKRAKILGYEIHAFAWEVGAVCSVYADYYYPISFTEIDKIVKICQENRIQGITSFSLESALPFVYKVSEEMGWSFPSKKCQEKSINKYTMRKAFLKYGVSIPQFLETQNDSIQVDFYPVVVKPVDSGGSRGVTKVEKFEDLKAAINRALTYSEEGMVLIEQFIDGTEYSVESISYQGKHHIVAITEKVTSGPPYFVELAHFQPAELLSDKKNQLIELVNQGLKALDYTDGPSHTEVKLGTDGIFRIIEVGLRLGGDFITSDLVRLSSGYDLVKASLDLTCGNFIAPGENMLMCSGVYFKAPQTSALWKRIHVWKQSSFFVESEDWEKEALDPTESSERQGYFIYQHNERLKLNGDF